MDTALTVVALATLVYGGSTALHLGFIGLASLFYRAPRGDARREARFLVLVPAHNEELVIGDTLAALRADLRPGDRVLVVADRCRDATAQIARDAGALVLERPDDAEPGRAAARQAGLEHALGRDDWDAMVMIDADSIVERGFFDACAAALADGTLALQARSEAAAGDRVIDQAALAAATIQGVLLPRGRDRLGLCVRLRGTGMVLDRSLLTRFRFRAPASEDLWYSLDLALAGILPRHVENARLRSVNAGSWRDAGEQRTRYEAGRMSAAKEFVGPLLRRHDAASIEAAWFLCSPPFAFAALLLVVSFLAAWLAGAGTLLWISGVLFVVLCGALALALVEAKVSARTWLALVIAPWYLPWKAVVQVRALGRVLRREQHYGATPRA